MSANKELAHSIVSEISTLIDMKTRIAVAREDALFFEDTTRDTIRDAGKCEERLITLIERLLDF